MIYNLGTQKMSAKNPKKLPICSKCHMDIPLELLEWIDGDYQCIFDRNCFGNIEAQKYL